MAFATRTRSSFDDDYRGMLRTLSEGSVHVHFDPYDDIDWDGPDMAIEADDPRWVLPALDPLGATAWYRAQPLDQQIAIGQWRMLNVVKVGAAFESALIRGLLHYAVELPNGSPEFRYCLHEMTEECNHIQMFQELVNRSGVNVPGMRPHFRLMLPFLGLIGGFQPVALMIGILGGEEPIDHYQKEAIRSDHPLPPALQRTMEIHIAEEARHISFAVAFLRMRLPHVGRIQRFLLSLLFPVIMRWLAGEIMTVPRSVARRFSIPRDVYKEAFWGSPSSREVLASYFGDMRALAADTGLLHRTSRRLWKRLGIAGEPSRYRGEPERTAELIG
jgi:hypothetical protein